MYTSLVALLAQLAEQLTLNQRVTGSSPVQGIEEKCKYFALPTKLEGHGTLHQLGSGSSPVQGINDPRDCFSHKRFA